MTRATCWRCFKPATLCVCARTQVVANRTRVLLLQHRRERAHPVGTARIARLGLAAVEVREAVGAVARPDLAPDAALLYPSDGARDLETLPPTDRPSQLVVLDGTWRHARRLFLDNPWLADLPHVRLSPEEPSRYRIRKQPAEHCVSTLESVVSALRILEPETVGLDGLLEVFDSMIDDQQAYMQNPASTPRHQQRAPRASRAVPAALLASPERLLVVYGESAPAQPAGMGGAVPDTTTRRRHLVRWSAVRPATGEVFDRLVQPVGAPPQAGHIAHMGLSSADFRDARSLADVGAAWRSFRRADDLVAAWHPAVLRMLVWVDPTPAETLLLRALWANVTRRKPGALADMVVAQGLAVEQVSVPGRSALRLGEAVAAARELVRIAPRMAHLREEPSSC